MLATIIVAFGPVMTSTLKTFSAIHTNMLNICGKFQWNNSTKYNDIASREIDVNGRTDGRRSDRKA